MNLKEFFKPTIAKIVLFLVLFGLFTFFDFWMESFVLCDPCPCLVDTGSPFPFFNESRVGQELTKENYSCGTIITTFNLEPLVIDLIFWYLISCSIIFAFNKFKEKKK